jgi:arsenite methyltransferase
MHPETTPTFDADQLEVKVKEMYREVAEHSDGSFHFEMGRQLAERLGYPPSDLDRVPAAAIESFAGVGYFFDLAQLEAGEEVVDLGSGSGTDAFVAGLHVGESGKVTGVDMTPAQLAKAEQLGAEAGVINVEFTDGHIEHLPFANATFDVVISNGVINLAPDKQAVFAEAARVLRPGGRLAIADIVTERPLHDDIVANTDLWASCIGGAAQKDAYQQAIEAAGFTIATLKTNPYQFISDQARNASDNYGVKSVSILAHKKTNVPPSSVGGTVLEALARRDFGRLAAALRDDVHLRALLPGGLTEWHGRVGVEEAFTGWFGAFDEFEVVDAVAGEVGTRLHLRWRLRVGAARTAGRSLVVEQQVYADADADDQIYRLSLLCSGFCPEGHPWASGLSPPPVGDSSSSAVWGTP